MIFHRLIEGELRRLPTLLFDFIFSYYSDAVVKAFKEGERV
jgi:hypothetical protein